MVLLDSSNYFDSLKREIILRLSQALTTKSKQFKSQDPSGLLSSGLFSCIRCH